MGLLHPSPTRKFPFLLPSRSPLCSASPLLLSCYAFRFPMPPHCLLRQCWQAGVNRGLAICAVALAFGFIRLQQSAGASVRVAALADTGERIKSFRGKIPAPSLAASRAYAAALREIVAGRGRIDIAAIPEGAISMHQEWGDSVLTPLAAAAKDTGTTIVVGTSVPKPVLNRAFAFLPNGSVIHYDKRHPLQPMDREIPGTAPGLLGNSRAMAICKDMDFPASIRSDVQSGVRLMIVPASDFTRDNWVHARIAIMRGVENGSRYSPSGFQWTRDNLRRPRTGLGQCKYLAVGNDRAGSECAAGPRTHALHPHRGPRSRGFASPFRY